MSLESRRREIAYAQAHPQAITFTDPVPHQKTRSSAADSPAWENQEPLDRALVTFLDQRDHVTTPAERDSIEQEMAALFGRSRSFVRARLSGGKTRLVNALIAAWADALGHCGANRRSLTGLAVDGLAEQVGMTVVSCVLLDHVQQDPPKAEAPAAA